MDKVPELHFSETEIQMANNVHENRSHVISYCKNTNQDHNEMSVQPEQLLAKRQKKKITNTDEDEEKQECFTMIGDDTN